MPKQNLKLFITTFSGNVGKSTLAYQFFAPMMQGSSKVFSIESINDVQGEKISPKDLNNVLVEIDLEDNAIVDVGSSNIEQIIPKLKGIINFSSMFDLFIVPTSGTDLKQQRDGVKMLDVLINDLGVKPAQIRVIYNRCSTAEIAELEFMNEAITRFKIPFSPVSIPNDELFAEMDKTPIKDFMYSPAELLSLEKEILSETDKPKKRTLLTKKLYSNRVAGLFNQLKASFNALNLYA